jgi:hypothetical protein
MLRGPARRSPSRPFARRVIAVAAALAIGLLGVTVAVEPAFASGDLTGTLVDQLDQPVLGLTFDVWSSSTGTLVSTVTSDGTTGDFDLSLPDGSYYYWVHDGATDLGGDSYGLRSESFFITGADDDLGHLVIQKYVDVSGTISNWTAPMGNITVQVKTDSGGGWSTIATGTSTGASFTVPATIVDGDYTLYFQLDPASTAPYLDAYLGGQFFDPAHAAPVTGHAGTPISGISMTMPDAAFISGTVTGSDTGLGLSGIYVSTEDRPDYQFFADTYTDSNGDYSLRVVPGLTYAVYADDPASDYLSMTYQNLDGCGCSFTPVTSTYADPATGIDFALIKDSSAAFIAGVVLDDSLSGSPSPFDNVQVHLYKPVTGGWSQIDVVQTDNSGEFQLTLPAFGSYRLRFEFSGTWLPVIDGLVGQGSASGPDPATPGCAIDTGSLDASSVSSHVAYYVIAGLDQAGGCAAEPAPSSSSGGSSSSGHGRSHPATVVGTATIPVAVPTPTPTATPSPSPSASDDSTPSPQPSSPPITTTGLDLTWLWILLAVLLAIVILFIVIWAVRARRA